MQFNPIHTQNRVRYIPINSPRIKIIPTELPSDQAERLKNLISKTYYFSPNVDLFSLAYLPFTLNEFESQLKQTFNINESHLLNEAVEHVIANIEYTSLDICYSIKPVSFEEIRMFFESFIKAKISEAKISLERENLTQDYFFRTRQIFQNRLDVEIGEVRFRFILIDKEKVDFANFQNVRWVLSLQTHQIHKLNSKSTNEDISYLRHRKLLHTDLNDSDAFTLIHRMTQGFDIDNACWDIAVRQFVTLYPADDIDRFRQEFFRYQQCHYPMKRLQGHIHSGKISSLKQSPKICEITKKKLQDLYDNIYFKACYEFAESDRSLPSQTPHKDCLQALQNRYLQLWNNIETLQVCMEKPVDIVFLMRNLGDLLPMDLKRLFSPFWHKIDPSHEIRRATPNFEAFCEQVWKRNKLSDDCLKQNIGPQLLNLIGPSLFSVERSKRMHILESVLSMFKTKPKDSSELKRILKLSLALEGAFQRLSQFKHLTKEHNLVQFNIVNIHSKCPEKIKSIDCLNWLGFVLQISKVDSSAYRKYCLTIAKIGQEMESMLQGVMTLILSYPDYTQELLVIVRGLYFLAWIKNPKEYEAYAFPFSENPKTPRLAIRVGQAYLSIHGNPIKMTCDFISCYNQLEKAFSHTENCRKLFESIPANLGLDTPALTKDNFSTYAGILAEAFLKPPITTILSFQYNANASPFFEFMLKHHSKDIGNETFDKHLLSFNLEVLRMEAYRLGLPHLQEVVNQFKAIFNQTNSVEKLTNLIAFSRTCYNSNFNGFSLLAVYKYFLRRNLNAHLATLNPAVLLIIQEFLRTQNYSFINVEEIPKIFLNLLQAYKKIGLKDNIVSADRCVDLAKSYSHLSDEMELARTQLQSEILVCLPQIDEKTHFFQISQEYFLWKIQQPHTPLNVISIVVEWIVESAMRVPSQKAFEKAAGIALKTMTHLSHNPDQISQIYLLARQFFYSSHMESQTLSYYHMKMGLSLLVNLANKYPEWEKQNAIQTFILKGIANLFTQNSTPSRNKIFKIYSSYFSELNSARMQFEPLIRIIRSFETSSFKRVDLFAWQFILELTKVNPALARILLTNPKFVKVVPVLERSRILSDLLREMPNQTDENSVWKRLSHIAEIYSEKKIPKNEELIADANLKNTNLKQKISILDTLSSVEDDLQNACKKIQKIIPSDELPQFYRHLCLHGNPKLIYLVHLAFIELKNIHLCLNILEGCSKISDPLMLPHIEQDYISNNFLAQIENGGEKFKAHCHLFEYLYNLSRTSKDPKITRNAFDLVDYEMTQINPFLANYKAEPLWHLCKYIILIILKESVADAWKILELIRQTQNLLIDSKEIDLQLDVLNILKNHLSSENSLLFGDAVSTLLHRISITHPKANTPLEILSNGQQQGIAALLQCIHKHLDIYPTNITLTYIFMMLQQLHVLTSQFLHPIELKKVSQSAKMTLEACQESLYSYNPRSTNFSNKFIKVSRYICLSSQYHKGLGIKIIQDLFSKTTQYNQLNAFGWFTTLLHFSNGILIYQGFHFKNLCETALEMHDRLLFASIGGGPDTYTYYDAYLDLVEKISNKQLSEENFIKALNFTWTICIRLLTYPLFIRTLVKIKPHINFHNIKRSLHTKMRDKQLIASFKEFFPPTKLFEPSFTKFCHAFQYIHTEAEFQHFFTQEASQMHVKWFEKMRFLIVQNFNNKNSLNIDHMIKYRSDIAEMIKYIDDFISKHAVVADTPKIPDNKKL